MTVYGGDFFFDSHCMCSSDIKFGKNTLLAINQYSPVNVLANHVRVIMITGQIIIWWFEKVLG